MTAYVRGPWRTCDTLNGIGVRSTGLVVNSSKA